MRFSSALVGIACLSNAAWASTATQASSAGSCLTGLAAESATSSRDDASIFELILAQEYGAMDPVLPSSIVALKERGAHRCWHKHSTFLEHLVGVHNILRLWGESETVGRIGLFHSAYSNSYVNLALYDPNTERDVMKELIGGEAEDFVHLFCIIDRQEVVVNTLLKQGHIPKEGLSVPHLRHPEERVFLNAETLRMLVVFTMADISDQYFGWQDQLFGGGGEQGSMIIPGQDFLERHDSTAIWPGISRPGLWMSYVSQLAKVARTFNPNWSTSGKALLEPPPVFASGTQLLSVDDEAEARDLYWKVVMGDITDEAQALETLRLCSQKNPWAFEPLILIAQKLSHQNDFEGAMAAAGRALELQQQWGTAWDKRLSFGAWVAFARVLYQRAEDEKPWPNNSWDVNNFGLVR